MLLTIREYVSKAFDKELGEHYSGLRRIIREEDFNKFDKRTNEILSDERFKKEDEDIVDFLFAPDESGKVSYRTCKKIYDLIKDIKDEGSRIVLRYSLYSNNDWEDFKQLLKDCYSNRCNLTWR